MKQTRSRVLAWTLVSALLGTAACGDDVPVTKAVAPAAVPTR